MNATEARIRTEDTINRTLDGHNYAAELLNECPSCRRPAEGRTTIHLTNCDYISLLDAIARYDADGTGFHLVIAWADLVARSTDRALYL